MKLTFGLAVAAMTISAPANAAALSDALADALDTGSDAPLDDYAATRRAAASEVLAMTDRLTRVATLANPATRWLRNRLIGAAATLPPVRRLAARTLAGFN